MQSSYKNKDIYFKFSNVCLIKSWSDCISIYLESENDPLTIQHKNVRDAVEKQLCEYFSFYFKFVDQKENCDIIIPIDKITHTYNNVSSVMAVVYGFNGSVNITSKRDVNAFEKILADYQETLK